MRSHRMTSLPSHSKMIAFPWGSLRLSTCAAEKYEMSSESGLLTPMCCCHVFQTHWTTSKIWRDRCEKSIHVEECRSLNQDTMSTTLACLSFSLEVNGKGNQQSLQEKQMKIDGNEKDNSNNRRYSESSTSQVWNQHRVRIEGWRRRSLRSRQKREKKFSEKSDRNGDGGVRGWRSSVCHILMSGCKTDLSAHHTPPNSTRIRLTTVHRRPPLCSASALLTKEHRGFQPKSVSNNIYFYAVLQKNIWKVLKKHMNIDPFTSIQK